jgi:hypothetical protein
MLLNFTRGVDWPVPVGVITMEGSKSDEVGEHLGQDRDDRRWLHVKVHLSSNLRRSTRTLTLNKAANVSCTYNSLYEIAREVTGGARGFTVLKSTYPDSDYLFQFVELESAPEFVNRLGAICVDSITNIHGSVWVKIPTSDDRIRSC